MSAKDVRTADRSASAERSVCRLTPNASAMSASTNPGWLFAQQDAGFADQLADADVTTLAAALKKPEIADDRWSAEAAQIVSILFGFAPAAGAVGVAESKPSAKELEPNTVRLELGVAPDVMKYDRTELSVPAGRPVRG